MSSPNIFIVASFGRSGTVWLSKILNSHPDVMAYHEGAMKQVYPRGWFEAGMTETEHWFSAIKDMAPWDVELRSYSAVGDLNSFFGFHRIEPWENEFYRGAMRPRQEKILEGTRASFLARNPIVVLESKWRLLKSNWDFYRDYCLWYGRELIELNRDALGEFESEICRSIEARTFFLLCLHLRCAVRFGYPKVFRLEDLSTSVEATAKACEEITGVPFDSKQIAAVHAKRENVQRGAASYERNDEVIWRQWSPVFQRIFCRLCGDLPGRLGYPTVAPADQVLDQVIGLDCPEGYGYPPHHYPITQAKKDYSFAYRLKDLGFCPLSIIDVGGSDGSWTRRMAHLFPQAQLSIFEPLADHVPGFREGLEMTTSASPKTSLHKVALGASTAKPLMLIDARPQRSSCLPRIDGRQYLGAEHVLMLTLDMAVRKFQIAPPAFLKIDTGGYELHVLKGAEETLKSVEILFLETWLLRSPGADAALLPEVLDWLGRRGFFLTETLDDWHDNDGVRFSQRCVFMRENNPYFKNFGQRQFHLDAPAVPPH